MSLIVYLKDPLSFSQYKDPVMVVMTYDCPNGS